MKVYYCWLQIYNHDIVLLCRHQPSLVPEEGEEDTYDTVYVDTAVLLCRRQPSSLEEAVKGEDTDSDDTVYEDTAIDTVPGHYLISDFRLK